MLKTGRRARGPARARRRWSPADCTRPGEQPDARPTSPRSTTPSQLPVLRPLIGLDKQRDHQRRRADRDAGHLRAAGRGLLLAAPAAEAGRDQGADRGPAPDRGARGRGRPGRRNWPRRRRSTGRAAADRSAADRRVAEDASAVAQTLGGRRLVVVVPAEPPVAVRTQIAASPPALRQESAAQPDTGSGPGRGRRQRRSPRSPGPRSWPAVVTAAFAGHASRSARLAAGRSSASRSPAPCRSWPPPADRPARTPASSNRRQRAPSQCANTRRPLAVSPSSQTPRPDSARMSRQRIPAIAAAASHLVPASGRRSARMASVRALAAMAQMPPA